jgi:uncharacterized protein
MRAMEQLVQTAIINGDPLRSQTGAPVMGCRRGCGACCIAPSISSPLPGLPAGKPAGVPCPHLTATLDCALFDDPRRPAVCRSLRPAPDMCGPHRDAALQYLTTLEQLTAGAPT